jgi:hypothetical protein
MENPIPPTLSEGPPGVSPMFFSKIIPSTVHRTALVNM